MHIYIYIYIIYIYICIIYIYIYIYAAVMQAPNPCSVEQKRHEGTHPPTLLPVRDPPFATCTHGNK